MQKKFKIKIDFDKNFLKNFNSLEQFSAKKKKKTKKNLNHFVDFFYFVWILADPC